MSFPRLSTQVDTKPIAVIPESRGAARINARAAPADDPLDHRRVPNVRREAGPIRSSVLSVPKAASPFHVAENACGFLPRDRPRAARTMRGDVARSVLTAAVGRGDFCAYTPVFARVLRAAG